MKEAFDIMAAAIDIAYGDPEVRTSADVVQRIAEALAAHGYMIVPKDRGRVPALRRRQCL